jgi:hypothetical protein
VRPSRRPHPVLALALLGGIVTTAAACGHTEPFTVTSPDTVGPFPGGLPRRLTFNPLSDEMPFAYGDTLVFSRRDADRPDGDRCLAFLPVEGGRLLREACARGSTSDATRDAWLHPAISPDGRRVAFVRERGSILGGAPDERALVVAPLDQPDSAMVVVQRLFSTPSGVTGNAYRELTWRGNDTLRFLGGHESLINGELGGFVPLGVFDVPADPADTTPPAAIPGLEDALAYAPARDGSVYVVTATDPTAVYRWMPDSTPAPVAQFGTIADATLLQLTSVAFVDSVVVVTGLFAIDGVTLESHVAWADLATGGLPHYVQTFAAATRLAAVLGRRQVVLEAAESGRPDLWLLGFP